MPKKAHRALMLVSIGAAAVTVAGGLVGIPSASAGTSTTALATGLRPHATRIDFPVGDRVDATVDVGTGNLSVLTTDMTLPGVSKNIQLGLDYNSLLTGSNSVATPGAAGDGWAMRLGQDTKLVPGSGGTLLYQGPDGVQGVYTPSGTGGAYTSPAGFKNTLASVTGGGWTMTEHSSGEVATFTSAGQLSQIADRNGQLTKFVYFSNGQTRKILSSAGGSGASTAVFPYTYHGDVAVPGITQTGDNGIGTRSVAYGYTGDQLTSITDTAGRSTTFGYDSNGNLNDIINPGGREATFTFDSAHRVTAVQRDVGSSSADALTQFAYPSSTSTQVASPLTNSSNPVSTEPHTTYTLNSDDRVIAATDPVGHTRSTTYTPFTDINTSTNGLGGQSSTTHTANSGESLTGVTSATGANATQAFGGSGVSQYLPTGGADSQGNAATFGYDSLGNQTSSKNTAGAATASVSYHADGTPNVATDPKGGTVTYGENSTHQTTSITPTTTTLGATALTYDGYGRINTVTDGRGTTTTYDYNELGNLSSRTATSGGGSETYSYDLAGDLRHATDSRGTVNYTYDQASELTGMTSAQGETITFTYNGNAQRTDTYWNVGSTPADWAAHTHTDYDKAGRVARTWTARNSSDSTRVFDTSYCFSAKVTGQACPTTSSSTDKDLLQYQTDNLSTQTATFSYDSSNRLTAATNYGGHDYVYAYDKNGNRTSAKVDGTTTQTRGYDNNLITSTGYGYDAAGTAPPTRPRVP